MATPCASHGTQFTEKPTFSKTRGRYPTLDIVTTIDTSSAPCQFQRLVMGARAILLTYFCHFEYLLLIEKCTMHKENCSITIRGLPVLVT